MALLSARVMKAWEYWEEGRDYRLELEDEERNHQEMRVPHHECEGAAGNESHHPGDLEVQRRDLGVLAVGQFDQG